PERHRQIHDLDDLRGVGLRERPAEDGEVLREGEHLPAVHQPVPGDDAVAGDELIGHAEVTAPVGDELVDFLEGAGIEQQRDALARRQLAGGVLLPQTLLATAELGAALEVRQNIVRAHYALTACDFSQSFRNFSSPMLVSGWLNSWSMTAGGQVAM